MSALQTTPDYNDSDTIRCKRCDTMLPAHATFCGVCGERVSKDAKKQSQPDTTDVAERYRIVSLIRRRAYEQLFLAIDNQQQKPVVISDIDISSLTDDKRAEAIKATQREYDQLRHYRTPDVTPVIDLRYFQGHLFTISGWPFATQASTSRQSNTLQDLLQSGIGLPDEQTAIMWIYRLAQAVSNLHEQLIVIGDLDPHTIIVSDESYDGMPALIVGRLPLPVRDLLPHESALANTSHHFTAPEALLGNVEPGSDIYSLGAILYLLLTGTAPDEPERREQQALRSPRELNPRISPRVDEVVMRALAMEIKDRFESAEDMADTLLQLCPTTKTVLGGSSTPQKKTGKAEKQQKREKVLADEAVSISEETINEPGDDEVTVSVTPIQAQLARWYTSKMPTSNLKSREESNRRATQKTAEEQRMEEIAQQETRSIRMVEDGNHSTIEDQEAQTIEEAQIETPTPEPLPEPLPRPLQTAAHNTGEQQEQHVMRNFKDRITGVLPVLQQLSPVRTTHAATATPAPGAGDDDKSFLKRLQRFILGEQQHSTTAAALIETPLRIQPNQGYSLRIHLMGRDTPMLPPGTKKGTPPAGLSALVHGENVHIEVRSALFQNYAYIVQRADVQIPARGYAAEVTIPMQALTNGRSGRRERLHIFFMDEERKALYEKPFVIELFISHLVQSGREGHNVLSIPL